MFHKICQAFDEGGAKGMLMNNLRLSSSSCSLSFHFPTSSSSPSTTFSSEDNYTSTSNTITENVNNDDVNVPDNENNVITSPVMTTNVLLPLKQINLGDLLSRAQITSNELSQLSICPMLDIYREQIQIPINHSSLSSIALNYSTEVNDYDIISGYDNYHDKHVENDHTNHSNLMISNTYNNTNNDISDNFNNHDDNDNYDEGYDSFDDDMNQYDDNNLTTGATNNDNNNNTESMGMGKLRWDEKQLNKNNEKLAKIDNHLNIELEMLSTHMEQILCLSTGPSEYSYFDTNAMFTTNNAWAGAKHWKYATRKKNTITTSDNYQNIDAKTNDDDADLNDKIIESEVGNNSKKPQVGSKKNSKNKNKSKQPSSTSTFIDFNPAIESIINGEINNNDGSVYDNHNYCMTDEQEFNLFGINKKIKNKDIDSTIQSSTIIAKSDSLLSISNLILPPDAKVQVKDLNRLFLSSSIIIPSNEQQRHTFALASSSSSSSSSTTQSLKGTSKIDVFLSSQSGGSESIWGVNIPIKNVSVYNTLNGDGKGNVGDDHNYDDNFDDDNNYENGDEYDGSNNDDKNDKVLGLTINQNHLLQADRKVEKIEIR